jgi:N-acetylglucosaminyldiphosphoundecaprenol N-acetyl-beta-D-mannosaminyltransferase
VTSPVEHRRPAADSAAAGVHTLEVLGIPFALVDYEGAMDVMDTMVARRERGYVCAVAVHALMVAQEDRETRAALVGSTLVLPDGMPIVWALNWLGEKLPDRVYGPDLMLRYNERCARHGHRLWVYGGHDEEWLARLLANIRGRHPELQIVGGYSPPFRALTAEEESKIVERINRARPDVLWVGIGAPNQEKWMARMRGRLEVPVMCGVGAAFDFHAGRVSQAPGWMQARGLEWVYRFAQEPRRLFRRYAYYNPRFLRALAGQLLRQRL